MKWQQKVQKTLTDGAQSNTVCILMFLQAQQTQSYYSLVTSVIRIFVGAQ